MNEDGLRDRPLLRAVLCSGYDGQCFRAADVSVRLCGWYMRASARAIGRALSYYVLYMFLQVLYIHNLTVGRALSRSVGGVIGTGLQGPGYILDRALHTFHVLRKVEYRRAELRHCRLLSTPRQRPTPHHLTTATQPPSSSQPTSLHSHSEALQILSNHISRSFLSCILIAPLLSSPSRA